MIEMQFGRKLYKEWLMKVKVSNQVVQQKLKNQAVNNQGIGRTDNSLFDNFVLSRKMNGPELVFNQDPVKDSNETQRYFCVNAGEQWMLS